MSAPTIDRKRVRDVLARALHNSYSNAATGGGPLMELAEIFGIKHGDDADAVADALVPQDVAPPPSRLYGLKVLESSAIPVGEVWVGVGDVQKLKAALATLNIGTMRPAKRDDWCATCRLPIHERGRSRSPEEGNACTCHHAERAK